MKTMFTLLAALSLLFMFNANAQDTTTTTGAVKTAATETGVANLGEVQKSVEAIKAALDQLIKDMNSRTEAADRRLKAIEETLGTENMSRFGGISRQLDELQRDIDDIERKVDDIERNQR